MLQYIHNQTSKKKGTKMKSCEGILIMTFSELTTEQKLELKQALLLEREESVSFEEMANCDELVTDEELEAKWGSVIFTEDDFISKCDDSDKPF
jgi:hypothetical protein